jgi:hypothetical protein
LNWEGEVIRTNETNIALKEKIRKQINGKCNNNTGSADENK